MTEFNYYTLDDAHLARGVVVVIDVLRAFTTAAHAFDAGIVNIYPVAGVGEAILLRESMPGSLIMGEVDGEKPAEFDFGNSPCQFDGLDLHGCSVVQRTSAGTQGIIKASHVEHLFAASFVVANATAQKLSTLKPTEVSFIITGVLMGRDGDEDRACAEYIQALLAGENPQAELFSQRVYNSTAGKAFQAVNDGHELHKDLEMSILIDRFDFSMPIMNNGQLLVMCRDDCY